MRISWGFLGLAACVAWGCQSSGGAQVSRVRIDVRALAGRQAGAEMGSARLQVACQSGSTFESPLLTVDPANPFLTSEVPGCGAATVTLTAFADGRAARRDVYAVSVENGQLLGTFTPQSRAATPNLVPALMSTVETTLLAGQETEVVFIADKTGAAFISTLLAPGDTTKSCDLSITSARTGGVQQFVLATNTPLSLVLPAGRQSVTCTTANATGMMQTLSFSFDVEWGGISDVFLVSTPTGGGVADAAHSQISFMGGPFLANGMPVPFQVQLRDVNDRPVSGLSVNVRVMDGMQPASVNVKQPPPTNALGQSVGEVISNVAGVFQVFADVSSPAGNFTLQPMSPLTFTTAGMSAVTAAASEVFWDNDGEIVNDGVDHADLHIIMRSALGVKAVGRKVTVIVLNCTGECPPALSPTLPVVLTDGVAPDGVADGELKIGFTATNRFTATLAVDVVDGAVPVRLGATAVLVSLGSGDVSGTFSTLLADVANVQPTPASGIDASVWNLDLRNAQNIPLGLGQLSGVVVAASVSGPGSRAYLPSTGPQTCASGPSGLQWVSLATMPQRVEVSASVPEVKQVSAFVCAAGRVLSLKPRHIEFSPANAVLGRGDSGSPSQPPPLPTGGASIGAATAAADNAVDPQQRFFSFSSDLDLLFGGDTNGVSDAYWFNAQTNELRRVSIGLTAGTGRAAFTQSMSRDGRFVAFIASGPSLDTTQTVSGVNPDTRYQAYVRDMSILDGACSPPSPCIRMISASDVDGSIGNASSSNVSLAADAAGPIAVYESDASNLDGGVTDTDGLTDIILWRGSGAPTGNLMLSDAGAKVSRRPSISALGTSVVFEEALTVSAEPMVMKWDAPSSLSMISDAALPSPPGTPLNGGARAPVISANGQVVVFETFGDDFTAPSLPSGRVTLVSRDFQTGQRRAIASIADNLGSACPQTQAAGGGVATPDPIDATQYCFGASVSEDGRYVTYQSVDPVLSGAIDAALVEAASDPDLLVTDLKLGGVVRLSNNGSDDGGGCASNTEVGPQLGQCHGAISQSGANISWFSSQDVLHAPAGATPNALRVTNPFVHSATEILSRSRASFPAFGLVAASGVSQSSRISTDKLGRFSSFVSDSADLVAGLPGGPKVFVSDRLNRQVEVVSFDPTGVLIPAPVTDPVISGNGQYVAFVGNGQIWLHDRAARSTRLVSGNPIAANGSGCDQPSIAADGATVAVAFRCAGNVTNLPTSNGASQIYVANFSGAPGALTLAGGLVTVSIDPGTLLPFTANASSPSAAVGPSGLLVAFVVQAAAQNGVYVRGPLGTLTIASSVDGYFSPIIASSGAFLAFETTASSVDSVTLGGNSGRDIVGVRLNAIGAPIGGSYEQVNLTSKGSPPIGAADFTLHGLSSDGRFVLLTAQSPGYAKSFSPRVGVDLYLRDRRVNAAAVDRGADAVRLMSHAEDGGDANDDVLTAALSADGRNIEWTSRANNIGNYACAVGCATQLFHRINPLAYGVTSLGTTFGN